MELDEALDAAVPLGRVQFILVVASMLMNIQTGFTTLSNVFLAKIPPHHCANHSGFSLNDSIPVIDGTYAQCEEYIDPLTRTDTRPCSNGLIFYTEETGHSVVSDWELVCSKDFLPGLSQSLLLAGFAAGSFVGGPLADKYGRRPTILICLLIFSVIGLSVSLVQSFAVFITLRFVMAAIFKGVRIPLINMLFESLTPRYRPLVGTLPTCVYSIGLMMMAGFAYLVRDWRKLNVILLMPNTLMLTFFWVIPESPRWLLSQNKTEEAEMTMQKIAAMNKAKGFPSPVFAEETTQTTTLLKSPNKEDNHPDLRPREQTSGMQAFTQLIKQPALTVTLVLSWTMITGALTYFGFALTTGTLAGGPYLNFFISSLADLFALFIAVFAIKRIGSLKTLITGMLGAAIAMIAIIVLPYLTDNETLLKILLTVFAIGGRFCISLGWQPIILLTSDLFPTSVRNSGTALVHLIGNFGSLASPLVIYLNKFYRNLSFMVMVVCCLLSVVLSLLLPETLNTTQPETLKDLKLLFDTKRLVRFRRKRRETPPKQPDDIVMSALGSGR